MFRIFKALRWREWLYMALSVCFIVLQVWLDLTMPDYMSSITRLAVSGTAAAMGGIWRDGALMLACALGSFAAAACTVVCVAKIAANSSAHLRELLLRICR